jgi:hypothetical protein
MSCPQSYLPEKAPESFEELTKLYLPRKLQDRLGYERALAVIDWLTLQAHTKDQRTFLSVLPGSSSRITNSSRESRGISRVRWSQRAVEPVWRLSKGKPFRTQKLMMAAEAPLPWHAPGPSGRFDAARTTADRGRRNA